VTRFGARRIDDRFALRHVATAVRHHWMAVGRNRVMRSLPDLCWWSY
jgi:hypothetical protein